MARLGIFCLPMSSHINLFLALAEELATRSHQIAFFNLPENEGRIRAAGFEFVSVEPDDLPKGTLGQMVRDMGKMGPVSTMRLQGKFDDLRYHAILKQGPGLVRAAGLDALIVDQAEACSGSVAEALGLPWASVANGLCMNSEPLVPPFFTSWAYRDSFLSIARNRVAYAGIKIATQKTESLINKYRLGWGLQPLRRMDDCFSPFAQICQQNLEFDFPRRELPEHFHYVGPIRSTKRTTISFPWEKLDGRPLIYASLGTVVNRHQHLYQLIAKSCMEINAQLVISLGGADQAESYRNLPGHPLVVEFAPQRELLGRAALTVTHAGLNTTLESLSQGVPLVALPITFEQPGIAARIRWTGTGEFVPMAKATPKRLSACIAKVFGDPSYKRAAEAMSAKINSTPGSKGAADIIENVVAAGRTGKAKALTTHNGA